jgi:pyruvate/2-oxoglutarate dehydrogenase complex dihydrolipoamide dehydrogenase (E3) component
VAQPWDLLVVGGGTAGLVAAYAGAEIGARVALVERDRTGGDCLWTGCVPSKALLSAAGAVAAARHAGAFAQVGPLDVDFAAVMAHVRSAIRTIEPVDSPRALEAAGVTVLAGDAVFTGPRSLIVDGATHKFHHAVVATGAAPRVPPVEGLDEGDVLTSETVWGLDALPPRMLVVGGGPVGCELSQAFARLGSRVTLVEAGHRLLPREDPEAASIVAAALAADGVDVRMGCRVQRVLPGLDPRSGIAVTSDGGGEHRVEYDAVLVAVGRTPRTHGLGLASAGVALTDAGAVVVDRYQRTSNPRVWAAGDVTPVPHLTHLAAAHAGAAASNALLGLRRSVAMNAVPRVTYTDPEVAAVGVPTWASAQTQQPRTITRHHDHVDRAIADGRTAGFSRLTLGPRGNRVIGATIVGPRAGESIALMTLAIRTRTTTTGLAATVHAYPTYTEGPWNAAVDEVRRRLAHPTVQRALAATLAARRARWRRPS